MKLKNNFFYQNVHRCLAKDYYLHLVLIDNLKDNTVFFITHRLATIKNSDQIIVMHNGKLDEMGSYQKLMSNKGRYFALESQQGNIG